MERISKIFAFVAANVDYWEELLGDNDYPEELEEDERRAVDAARPHIEESIVALLHSAAATFASTQHDPPFVPKQPRRSSTLKNRDVSLYVPAGREDLYGLGFWLTTDDLGKVIYLYPYLSIKKSRIEDIKSRLTRSGVKYEHKGGDYYVYALPVELTEGTPISELAALAASRLVELVDKSVA